MADAGGDGGLMPEVAGKLDDPDPRVAARRVHDQVEGPVAGSVVDQNQLEILAPAASGRERPLQQLRKDGLFVVDWNDDRDHRGKITAPRWPLNSKSPFMPMVPTCAT